MKNLIYRDTKINNAIQRHFLANLTFGEHCQIYCLINDYLDNDYLLFIAIDRAKKQFNNLVKK